MGSITLIAVGDIAFDGGGGENREEPGHIQLLRAQGPLLSSGDLVFGNLESPITDAESRNECHYSKLADDQVLGRRAYLKAPRKTIGWLKAFGFNILSIANNHILDYQKKGLVDTLTNLSEGGILPVGAGLNLGLARRPVIMNVKSFRIGFLAYSYTYEATRTTCGCAPIWRFLIRQDLKALRDEVDRIVVSFHYGKEFSTLPSRFQREISRMTVDNGADIVVGHHPHVVQPVEVYRGKVIAYSQGNFYFDDQYENFHSREIYANPQRHRTSSSILKVTINDDESLTPEVFPISGLRAPEDHEGRFTKYGLEESIHPNLLQVPTLVKLASISIARGNKTNVQLLILRVLSGLGLL